MKDAQIQHSTPAECLQWHPEKAILTVGWSSGEITVFNLSEPNLFEQSNVHKKPLVFLVWNATGRRLISGDKVYRYSSSSTQSMLFLLNLLLQGWCDGCMEC